MGVIDVAYWLFRAQRGSFGARPRGPIGAWPISLGSEVTLRAAAENSGTRDLT